jgi:PKD domain-containing protein
MRPVPVAALVTIALIPFTGCTDPSPSGPLSDSPTRGVSADVVGGTTITVAFSSFGSGQVFDPTFFDASGIDFPPQQCDPGCHTWFVGFIQGSPALTAGVVNATFTHPVSDLSLLVAPALQGTATYTLKAFDASGSLLASTSVTVTQDQGDPATIAYGYFPIALATLPAPATSFTLDNVFVRSSFPNTVGAIPYGVSTISFTPAVSTPPSATFLAAPDLDASVLSSTVIEGTSIKLALTNPAPAGASFTYAFDCGLGAGFGPFTTNNRAACPTVDNEVRNVKGRIRDADGTTVYSTSVTVVNQKPHVVLTTAQGSTIAIGAAFPVTGTFTDPGLQDATWSWTVSWGDGSITGGTALTQGAPLAVTHVYARAGIFSIKMTVTDKDGGTGKSNSIAVQAQ